MSRRLPAFVLPLDRDHLLGLTAARWTRESTGRVDPATGINPLQLLEKLATISGVIKDESGAVITGLAIPIKAWRVDGSEVGFTQTDPTTGQYTISVVYGEWSVWPMPTESR